MTLDPDKLRQVLDKADSLQSALTRSQLAGPNVMPIRPRGKLIEPGAMLRALIQVTRL